MVGLVGRPGIPRRTTVNQTVRLARIVKAITIMEDQTSSLLELAPLVVRMEALIHFSVLEFVRSISTLFDEFLAIDVDCIVIVRQRPHA